MRYILTVFVALIILPDLCAQVVIKEKVIVSPIKSETTKERAKTIELLPLDNPSLVQLDLNRFLVVRSGNLSFRLNSGHSIPNYRFEDDSLLVTLFKSNGTVTEMPSKAYHNQLIAPYLTTNRFGTDSTYWYQKFSEEYSDNFFNSTYVSNLNCVVFRGESYEKGRDETDVDFSQYQSLYSTLGIYEVDYFPGNDPNNERKTKECNFRREILLKTNHRIKAYGASLSYADLELYHGNYSSSKTSGSAVYTTEETWTDHLVRWDSRPIQRTKIQEIDGSKTDDSGNHVIVDLKEYMQDQLTNSATDHRFIIAPSQNTFHSFALASIGANVSRIKFKLQNDNIEPEDSAMNLGHVEAGDIIQLNTKLFPRADFFSGRGIDENTGSEVYPTEYEESIRVNPYYRKDISLSADILFEPENDSGEVSLKVSLGKSKEELNQSKITVNPGDSVYVAIGFQFSNGSVRKPEPYQVRLSEIFEGGEFGNLTTIAPDTFLVTTIDSLATDSAVIRTRFSADIGGGIIFGKVNPYGNDEETISGQSLSFTKNKASTMESSEISEEECLGSNVSRRNIYFGCGLIIIRSTSGGLYAQSEPDIISPGEPANLTAQYITAQSDTINFPAGQQFRVSLADSSAQYGVLISADNVDTADVLTNALQGFRFLADSAITDTTNVVVEISTQYEGRALKEDVSVTIQPSIQIEILLPDSAQVWPSIPQGGASTLFDFAQVDNTIGGIIVKMLNNGNPVSGQRVTISTEWIEGSGGHNHNGEDDLAQPPQNRMGWIVDIAEEDSAQGSKETVTNENGEIRLRYRAPEFGGKIRMVAQTNINRDTLFAADTVAVRVPGLVLLPNGNNLSKVGGTPRHHGPRVDSRYQNHRSPDNNHFGTQEFVDSLISLANNWASIVASDSDQDDRQVPLNINDLSLPNGGKFDLEGRWLTRLDRAAHDYHRVGRDVDIRTTRKFPIGNGRNGVLLTRLLNGNGIPVLDSEGNEIYVNRSFQRQIILHGANRKSGIHGSGKNEHYHVYFY